MLFLEPLSFLLLAFTLACTLGPLLGIAALIGWRLWRRADDEGFLITIGLPPRTPRTKKEKRTYDEW